MPKGKCLQVWPVWACRISHLLRLQQEGYRLSSPHHRSSRHRSFRLCEELEEVRILKDCGNLKLKDKDYQEAEKLYNQAILKLEEYREKVPAAQKGNMVFLESTTLLNLAKIKAEANDYTSLLNLSKSVVLISPDSGKGYYRYAEALYHLQKYGAALEKIKLAKKYATFDEIDELKAKILEKTGGKDEDEKKQSQEIDEIKEDKLQRPAQPSPVPPQMPPSFAGAPPIDMNQIDDSHLDMMKNMMSTPSGREMMKNIMKAQGGMDMTDEQLQMMSGMMNKETLQMAQGAMRSNPNLAGQRPNPAFPPMTGLANPTGGAGQQPAPDMQNFMADMQGGGQPSMDSLMKNKDMIKMTFNMLKTNPAMIRSVTAGLGESNPVSKFIQNRSDADLQKMAVWLERLMNCFMFCYPAIKIIKENFKTILIFIVLYFVYKYLL